MKIAMIGTGYVGLVSSVRGGPSFPTILQPC